MEFGYKMLHTIFNMSITASIMIIAVLAVRFLLRRAPKCYSYMLWGIVLIRLLCPVFPSSAFSVLNLADVPVTETGGIVYIPDDIVYIEYPANPQSVADMDDTAAESALPQQTELFGIPVSILTGIWLAGMAVLFIYGILSTVRLHKKTACSMQLSENIYLADHIPTPFVSGFLHPRIYLPSTLDKSEWKYIIFHEQYHIKRRDYLIKPAAFFCLCLHWFNPLVWLAFVLSGKDMEMSCDEAVMQKMDDDVRTEYAASLLHLATGRKIFTGAPPAFGEGSPKSRIKNIMNYKKPSFWVGAATAAVCIVAAVCLLTNPMTESNVYMPDDKGTQEILLTNPVSSNTTYAPDDKNGIDNGAAQETDTPDAKDKTMGYVIFQAHILEISNGTMLVEPVENTAERNSADQFSVPIVHMASSPEPVTGDLIEIAYNGDILESYPAQPGEIYRITVLRDENASTVSKAEVTVPEEPSEEEAIINAIMEHNVSDYSDDFDFNCCSFVRLEKLSDADTVTFYGWELYQEYKFSEKGIEELGGSHIPAALTFIKNDNGYTLREYWMPGDGSYYAPDIRGKFPAYIVNDGLDSQKFILQQKQNCYAQAVVYGQLDTDAIIEQIINTICSEPKDSSNPQDYIDVHDIEYRELSYYGDYTVRHCFKQFEQGNGSGLKGHIMARICEELLNLKGKIPAEAEKASTGQEWYDALKAHGGSIIEKYIE